MSPQLTFWSGYVAGWWSAALLAWGFVLFIKRR